VNPNVVRQQPSDDPQQPELLRVCRIGRAQGLKGEVTVQSFTDEPEYRFAAGSVLYARDGSEEYVVEHARTFKNRWIIKFESIENRDDAEAANGTELYGEADDSEDMLEEDAWYPKDLIGLEVRLAPDNGLGLPEGQGGGKGAREAAAAPAAAHRLAAGHRAVRRAREDRLVHSELPL